MWRGGQKAWAITKTFVSEIICEAGDTVTKGPLRGDETLERTQAVMCKEVMESISDETSPYWVHLLDFWK